MSDFFDSLYDGSLEEFFWLNGLDGGHFIEELLRGGDIFAAMDASKKYEQEYAAARLARVEEQRQKYKVPAFVGPLYLKHHTLNKTDYHDRVVGVWAEWTTWEGGPPAPEPLSPYEPPKRRARHSPPKKLKGRPDATIFVRPEGSGKSSMVAELVQKG